MKIKHLLKKIKIKDILKRKSKKRKENDHEHKENDHEHEEKDHESVEDNNNEPTNLAENSKQQKGKQKSIENEEGSSKRNSILLFENRIEKSTDSLQDDWDQQVNDPNVTVTLRENKGRQSIDPERRYSNYQVLHDARERYGHTIQKLKNNLDVLSEVCAKLQDECLEKDGQIIELERVKESYTTVQSLVGTKNKMLDKEMRKNFKLVSDIKELKNENEKQNEELQDLRRRIEELERGKDKIQDLVKEKDGLIKEKDEQIEEKDGSIKEKDEQIEEKVGLIKEKDEQIEEKDGLIKELSIQVENSVSLRESLKDEMAKLRAKNKTLMEENSEHQNYIGKASTFSLSDDDKNHSVQLVKDIEGLQTKIMDYVGNLRPRVELNLDEVNKLLSEYGCESRINNIKDKDAHNTLIKATIQRYVFEKILKEAKNYFENEKDNKCSEHKIYEGANCLLDIMSEFSKTREGTNEIIQALPIKIRQQIFGLLGNLGFADVIEGEEKTEHQFISTMKDTLNKSVNNIRKVKDPKKKKKHDEWAAELIREFIRIFWYRLNVQEPIAEYYWFPYNDKIDPNLMKGRWDNENEENDDNIEDNDHHLLVDVCAFPLIVANYKESDQKIYTHAKVNHQARRENGRV